MEVVVQSDFYRSTVIKVIVIPNKLIEGHINKYCVPSTLYLDFQWHEFRVWKPLSCYDMEIYNQYFVVIPHNMLA